MKHILGLVKKEKEKGSYEIRYEKKTRYERMSAYIMITNPSLQCHCTDHSFFTDYVRRGE